MIRLEINTEDILDSAGIEPLHIAPRVRILSVSDHLVVVPRSDGAFAAYHSLFGNHSIIDRELADVISELRGRAYSADELKATVGESIADSLYQAYYVVAPGEERTIVDGWLAERSAKVATGGLIGGLQITSSNACNFSCSYCFADSSDRRSPQRQSGAETPNISFETACRAIDTVLETAQRHGKQRIGVKFLGREPLVNYRVMRQLLDRYSTDQVTWSVTTNGSLVNEEIAEALAKAQALVVVSIDGLPTTNDVQRTLKSMRTASAYSLAMKGLQTLFAHGVAASVSSVVSANTAFDEMPEFFRQIHMLGCRHVELTLAMQTDLLQLQTRYDDQSRLVNDLVELYHSASSAGLTVSGDWIDPYHAILSNSKFRSDSSMNRPFGASCQASEHQVSVEPNGDLFPCRAMSLHYGNLEQWSAVLGSNAYRSVAMRTFYAVPYCNGCPLEGHCQGTCLGSLEEASGDIYNPQEQYCRIYRSIVHTLLDN